MTSGDIAALIFFSPVIAGFIGLAVLILCSLLRSSWDVLTGRTKIHWG